MRLLSTVTGQFVEAHDPAKVDYAILSHTWSTDGPEQTYEELKRIQEAHGLCTLTQSAFEALPYAFNVEEASGVSGISAALSPSHLITIWDDPAVSEKIKRACAVARDAGYSLLWIDSCCIDKTSSAELSEAINSMYAWYRESSICYAYLSDCPASAPDDVDSWGPCVQFFESRWFKRGWTLQELIAPRVVFFLSNDWQFFGTKADLADLIATVTTIDTLVLTNNAPLETFSVATRMSWAAKRETTRIEDRAYSLLGLFGITMSTIYGEGEQAFFRLQDEILRRISDQSIFAWGTSEFEEIDSLATSKYSSTTHPLLASSPDAFQALPVSAISHAEFARRLRSNDLPYPTHTFTPLGLRFQFPLVSLADVFTQYPSARSHRDADSVKHCLALLPCEPRNAPSALIAIVCSFDSDFQILRRLSIELDNVHVYRTIALTSKSLSACIPRVHTQIIFAPLEPVRGGSGQRREQGKIDYQSSEVSLELTRNSRDVLRAKGYAVSFAGPAPGLYRFILEKTRVVVEKNIRLGVEITFEFNTGEQEIGISVFPIHDSQIRTTTGRPCMGRREDLLLVAWEYKDFVWECKLRDSAGQERALRLSVLYPRDRDNAWTMNVETIEGERPASPSPATAATAFQSLSIDPSQSPPPPASAPSSRTNTPKSYEHPSASIVRVPLEPVRPSRLRRQSELESDSEPTSTVVRVPSKPSRPSRPRHQSETEDSSSEVTLRLLKGIRGPMEAQGYTISLARGDPGKYRFVLEKTHLVYRTRIHLGLEIIFTFKTLHKLVIWISPLYDGTIDCTMGEPCTPEGDYSFVLALEPKDYVWECKLRDTTGEVRYFRFGVLFSRRNENAWTLEVETREEDISDSSYSPPSQRVEDFNSSHGSRPSSKRRQARSPRSRQVKAASSGSTSTLEDLAQMYSGFQQVYSSFQNAPLQQFLQVAPITQPSASKHHETYRSRRDSYSSDAGMERTRSREPSRRSRRDVSSRGADYEEFD